MRLALPALAVLAVLALAAGALAARAEFDMGATLTWRQEVPRPAHPVRAATGTLSGDLDHQSRRLRWKLAYRRLSGHASRADIHYGRPGHRGTLLLLLCGRAVRHCKSGLSGAATVSTRAVLTLEAGYTYVEIHTVRNPRGEIRGQIAIKR
jgi:CHRD domain